MSGKPSLGRRITWRLEALAYDSLSLILKLFPFGAISSFGGALLRLIGPLTSKHAIARKGLTLAFPEKSDAAIKDLLKGQWENTGRTFAEFPIMHRVKAFADNDRVQVRGLKVFEAHKPAIFISGHFANWEVMATVLTQSGHPVRVTYRQINNPHIDKRVRQQRERYGTKFLVQKAGIKSGRELFDTLRGGESIAILNDQKFNGGLAVPFFGHDAMTAQGAVRLALKTGRPIVPMGVVREGAKFIVTYYPPLELSKTGTREQNLFSGVSQINRFMEDRVREHPEQWFWVHRRWPKEHYR